VFLLNGLLFLLVGLQLRGILESLSGTSLLGLVGNALLISLTCVLVRFVWVFATFYAPYALSGKRFKQGPVPSWKNVMIVAWTGLRGGLSLAAALALPLTLGNGMPFPQRDLIIFLTYSVILTTLVIQGLTLPVLIRCLGIKQDGSRDQEENRARMAAVQAALLRLQALSLEDWVAPEVAERLRERYAARLQVLQGRADGASTASSEEYWTIYSHLQQELLAAEHTEIVRLRDAGQIDDSVLHAIERELDLERVRLGLQQ
jgi:CPA1 family monovalent cation:H+ antiporter